MEFNNWRKNGVQQKQQHKRFYCPIFLMWRNGLLLLQYGQNILKSMLKVH